MGSDISEVLGGAFDPGSVEPATGYDPLPAGWYMVSIDGAEVKDTKAGNGKFLSIELTVTGEKYDGRKFWPKINLVNPSTKCVEIGMRELSALASACGLAALADTSEIIGRYVMARVKVIHEEGREPDNAVVAYKAADGSEPEKKPETQSEPTGAAEPATAAAGKPAGQPATKAATKPATAPAGKTKRPWER